MGALPLVRDHPVSEASPAGSAHDVVVIGGGVNGLTAALFLAEQGYDVALLERNAEVGGAIASAQVTEPGLVHDLYSTNQNLFLASAVHARFGARFEQRGLRFAHTDLPFANVYPGAASLRVVGDVAETLRGLGSHDPADAAGFGRLYELYQRYAPTLFELYASEVPSPRNAAMLARLVRAEGRAAVRELARLCVSTTRELGNAWFRTPEAKAMAACWGMHLDFAPDVAGGAVFPFLEMFADMENGMSVVEGGAGKLTHAMAAVLTDLGGTVRVSACVDRVLVQGGRATGVVTADGETVIARRAVVSNAGTHALHTHLLRDAAGPTDGRNRSGFAYGPGTLMLHLALSGPIPWEAGADLSGFAYVHVGHYVDDLARTYQQAQAGLLPSAPMLVVGQTSAIDATRSPDDRHVVWVQVRAVPGQIRGDGGGDISALDWEAAKEPMVDRVLGQLEDMAPGVRSQVRSWSAMSPADLVRANPALVGGDSVAGSHHLSQNLVFRRSAGGRYRGVVPGLYETGAGVWPGAGTHATSGRLVALRVDRDSSGPIARALRAARRASPVERH